MRKMIMMAIAGFLIKKMKSRFGRHTYSTRNMGRF